MIEYPAVERLLAILKQPPAPEATTQQKLEEATKFWGNPKDEEDQLANNLLVEARERQRLKDRLREEAQKHRQTFSTRIFYYIVCSTIAAYGLVVMAGFRVSPCGWSPFILSDTVLISLLSLPFLSVLGTLIKSVFNGNDSPPKRSTK